MESGKICDQTRARLDAYLQNELEEAWRKRIENHVAACPRCRETMEELRQLNALLSSALSPSPTPEGLNDRIIHALREQAFSGKRDITWLDLAARTVSLGLWLTLLAVLGGIGWGLLRFGPSGFFAAIGTVVEWGGWVLQERLELLLDTARKGWLTIYRMPEAAWSSGIAERAADLLQQPWLPDAATVSLLWLFVVCRHWLRTAARTRT